MHPVTPTDPATHLLAGRLELGVRLHLRSLVPAMTGTQ